MHICRTLSFAVTECSAPWGWFCSGTLSWLCVLLSWLLVSFKNVKCALSCWHYLVFFSEHTSLAFVYWQSVFFFFISCFFSPLSLAVSFVVRLCHFPNCYKLTSPRYLFFSHNLTRIFSLCRCSLKDEWWCFKKPCFLCVVGQLGYWLCLLKCCIFFCCSLECSSQVIFNPSAASEVTAASLRVFTSCGVCLRQQKTFTTRISEESRKQEMYSVTLHIVGQYKAWESFVCGSPV